MIKLNLLPKTLRKRVEPGWWRLTAIIFPLVIFGIIALIHVSTLSRISQLESERNQLQAEVAVLQPYIKRQRELKQRKAELEQIIRVDQEIKANFVAWSDNIAKFINQIPRRDGRFEVFLRSINTKLVPPDTRARLAEQGMYDRKKIAVEFTVQGEARSADALVRFVKAFEDSPDFGINFQQGSRTEDGGYTFTATIGLTEQGAAGEGGEANAR
ncbi:flagellar protein FliT [Oceanithermus sp.]